MQLGLAKSDQSEVARAHHIHLSDLWKKEKGHYGAENTQRTRNEEGILPRSDFVRGILLNDRDHIGPYKGTDFACSSSNAVVLTANGSCAALCCTKADVISGA